MTDRANVLAGFLREAGPRARLVDGGRLSLWSPLIDDHVRSHITTITLGNEGDSFARHLACVGAMADFLSPKFVLMDLRRIGSGWSIDFLNTDKPGPGSDGGGFGIGSDPTVAVLAAATKCFECLRKETGKEP